MKKRTVSLVLALIIITSIPIQASADTSGVCFTAIGDSLLDLSSMACFSGGNVYVPAKVFSNYGVYLNYFESTATAYMYNDSKKVFFELNSGNTTNDSGTTYSVSAIIYNSQVYVPVGWTSAYFGLSYSYINGTGNGDIVRLKNGAEVLTDSKFLNAASNTMKYYYNEYFGPPEPVNPSPSPSPTLTPETTEPPDDDNKQNTYVFLAFTGTPTANILDILDRYGYSASFFVSADDAGESDDLLRRIYGSGHNIGVYCTSDFEGEFDICADKIFNAVQVRPTLISSPAELSEKSGEFGNAHGLADYSPHITISAADKSAADAISRLDDSAGYIRLSIELAENSPNILVSLFKHLSSKHYTVLPLLETYI